MFTYQIQQDCIDEYTEYIANNCEFIFKENESYVIAPLKFTSINYTKINYGSYDIKYKEHNIRVLYDKEGTPKAVCGVIDYYENLSLSCENREILDDFCNTVLNDNKNKKNKEPCIYTCCIDGYWDFYGNLPKRDIDSVYIPDNLKNKILNDIEIFYKSEDEYLNFGIPYKRVYLLTGKPGNGKTSLVKALCNYFKKDLNMLTISKGFGNNSLMNCMSKIKKNTFLLMEDIDCLFHKRESTSDNTSITFSSIINILDGVLSHSKGNIICMTTNHPEKLDSALLRIGRVDMIINITNPDKTSIEKLFNDLMKKYIVDGNIQKEFESFYSKIIGKNICMSSIVNFLFRHRNEWRENIAELIDNDSFIKKAMNENSSNSLYT